MKTMWIVVLLFWLHVSADASESFTPEEIGRVATLPEVYPDHWVIAHDAAFFHMLEGRMLVLDATAETPRPSSILDDSPSK